MASRFCLVMNPTIARIAAENGNQGLPSSRLVKRPGALAAAKLPPDMLSAPSQRGHRARSSVHEALHRSQPTSTSLSSSIALSCGDRLRGSLPPAPAACLRVSGFCLERGVGSAGSFCVDSVEAAGVRETGAEREKGSTKSSSHDSIGTCAAPSAPPFTMYAPAHR
jgi:hypothetical protein